jgi:hypothetical protein
MHIQFLEVRGNWRDVADAARTTVGKEPGTNEPSAAWKRRILLAEHSPIRQITIRWKWVELKYWISVHFVRHKVGIEHFVSTQRTDRTGQDRDVIPQAALVKHECLANAQSVITISRKRLCQQAAAETRAAWQAVLDALQPHEPEIAAVCVPECVYRGFCPEMKSCGYHTTTAYQQALTRYHGTHTGA